MRTQVVYGQKCINPSWHTHDKITALRASLRDAIHHIEKYCWEVHIPNCNRFKDQSEPKVEFYSSAKLKPRKLTLKQVKEKSKQGLFVKHACPPYGLSVVVAAIV
ncbi:hypothetical protein DPMN_180733 [Dreissena polymorpha]|uniref:Uncharacterized protein n=1 Tax=Dreissena polymorpha TaxID=45954 RepID=A0A9D4DCB2_DREPO|nr:hypothetical protein DPMN_180733 [Dreissena polymorpha]